MFKLRRTPHTRRDRFVWFGRADYDIRHRSIQHSPSRRNLHGRGICTELPIQECFCDYGRRCKSKSELPTPSDGSACAFARIRQNTGHRDVECFDLGRWRSNPSFFHLFEFHFIIPSLHQLQRSGLRHHTGRNLSRQRRSTRIF